jgi:hypothetical protein
VGDESRDVSERRLEGPDKVTETEFIAWLKRAVVSSRTARTGEEDRIFDVIVHDKVLVNLANHTIFQKSYSRLTDFYDAIPSECKKPDWEKRVVAAIIKNLHTDETSWERLRATGT